MSVPVIRINGLVEIFEIPVVLSGSVPAATIASGSLLYIKKTASVGYVDLIENFTWDTDLATTQAELAVLFAGVAIGQSTAASTDARALLMLTETRGVFKFNCTSAQYSFGQWLGPAKAGGNALTQNLVAVATKSLALARCVENTAAASVTVKAELVNTLASN